MNNKGFVVTTGQLFFIIVQTQVGVGVLSLPYDVIVQSKQDAWLSMLAAGVIVQLLLFGMIYIIKHTKAPHYFLVCEEVLGKWIGKGVSLFYLLYYLGISTTILLLFSSVMQRWAFPHTPTWVILLLFIIPAIYICTGTLEHIGRFYVLVSILLFLLVFLVAWVFENPTYTYLLPLFDSSWKEFLLGMKGSIIALIGFDAFLIFGSALKEKKVDQLVKASLANFAVTLFYVFILISTLVFFHIEEVKVVPEPVLYILKALSFTIVDRIDLLFLMLWVVSTVTSFMTYLFSSSIGLQSIFQSKSHIPYVFYTAICVYMLSIYPWKSSFLKSLTTVVGNSAFVMFGIIPLLLVIVITWKKRKNKGVDTSC